MKTHNHTECIHHALHTATLLCAEKGVRLTPLRKEVLRLVWQSHKAVKAYDLLAQMGEDAKPPTVYRALDFLLEHGLVHRIESMNAFVGCPHPQEMHQGEFLICTRCGTVEEMPEHAVRHALRQSAKSAGFTIHHSTIEVIGICRKCHA